MASFTAPDGVRLFYEIEGTGPPLLLHLGAGCDAGLWRAAGYVEPLAKTHRCILFDHRGHGKSDRPAPRPTISIATPLTSAPSSSTLESTECRSGAIRVGSLIGLKVAEQHPRKIKALIGSGVIGRMTAEQLAAAIPQRVAGHREKGWEELLAGFDAEEIHAVPQWMKERIRATDIQPYIGWWQARANWDWEPWAAAPHIAAPTLFTAGEIEDPNDSLGELAATMPNATRVRIPERSHINAFLATDLVLPHVTEFLSRNSA